MRAVTRAPFTSTKPSSRTLASRVTGSPASTDSRAGAADTGSGVSAIIQRSSCRQKVS